MSGSLSNPMQTIAYEDFEPAEYKRRRQRLSQMMKQHQIDAFFINSEANQRYFTGHWSGRWTSRTRPIMLVIDQQGKATILCSVVEEGMARMCASECEVKTFGGTGHNLDPALKFLTDELRSMGLSNARVAAELGTSQRPQMAPGAYSRVCEDLPSMTLVDGTDILWKIRGVKSAAEVEYLKKAIDITHRMFDRLPEWLGEAKDEREVYHRLCIETLELGADQVGFFNVIADITQPFSGGFSKRPIEKNKVIYIDAGAILSGYWSDFDRLFCVGKPDDIIQDYYKRLWDVTEEGIEAVKVGRKISELYGIMRSATGRAVGELPMLGRVGHSIGLEIVETPSICPEDDREMEAGMVLMIEPSLKVPGGGTIIAEEAVLVTDRGAKVLTRRAPQQIPRL